MKASELSEWCTKHPDAQVFTIGTTLWVKCNSDFDQRLDDADLTATPWPVAAARALRIADMLRSDDGRRALAEGAEP